MSCSSIFAVWSSIFKSLCKGISTRSFTGYLNCRSASNRYSLATFKASVALECQHGCQSTVLVIRQPLPVNCLEGRLYARQVSSVPGKSALCQVSKDTRVSWIIRCILSKSSKTTEAEQLLHSAFYTFAEGNYPALGILPCQLFRLTYIYTNPALYRLQHHFRKYKNIYLKGT